MDTGTIVSAAEKRYLHDAEFHARVNRTIEVIIDARGFLHALSRQEAILAVAVALNTVDLAMKADL